MQHQPKNLPNQPVIGYTANNLPNFGGVAHWTIDDTFLSTETYNTVWWSGEGWGGKGPVCLQWSHCVLTSFGHDRNEH